jgi:hypothetical protein
MLADDAKTYDITKLREAIDTDSNVVPEFSRGARRNRSDNLGGHCAHGTDRHSDLHLAVC